MKYNVKWIINGETIKDASSQEEAEKQIKEELESFVQTNKNTFNRLGATAIQGSASLIKQ